MLVHFLVALRADVDAGLVARVVRQPLVLGPRQRGAAPWPAHLGLGAVDREPKARVRLPRRRAHRRVRVVDGGGARGARPERLAERHMALPARLEVERPRTRQKRRLRAARTDRRQLRAVVRVVREAARRRYRQRRASDVRRGQVASASASAPVRRPTHPRDCSWSMVKSVPCATDRRRVETSLLVTSIAATLPLPDPGS